MTCIIGMVDKTTNKTLIGGDSAGIAGYSIHIRKDPKVFKNGEFIFGCTTSFRMIQLLRFSFKPPEIKGKEIYEYMCTDFINEVRKCFLEGGYIQKYSDGDEKGGTFLVGYKNRLFKIEDDLQVSENLNGIDACGCGQEFALGSVFSLKDYTIKCDEILLKSLEVSEFYCNGVKAPFIILNT
jgi:ATP-dependent protease HslVU (ClpYQ) peptidase subunit